MDRDDEQKGAGEKRLTDKLRESSVKAAGIGYLIGDASLFASGLLSGRGKEAATGLIWGAGGLVCAKYGNPDAETQLKRLSGRLGDYLRKQDVEIPKNPTTGLLVQKGGLMDNVEEFFYKYPSQILNAGYAIGATQLIQSGMKHQKHWDTASGALVLGGALAGLLVKEKDGNEEKEETDSQGLHRKAMNWAKESPLRIPAIAYTLNDVTLTMSAIKEMRTNPAQKSYLFKFLTVGAYVFGNAMLYLSSKDNTGKGASSVPMEQLADVSAQVIAAQHPELREALINQVSVFLASQPEISMKAEEISSMLHARLNQMPNVKNQMSTNGPSIDI